MQSTSQLQMSSLAETRSEAVTRGTLRRVGRAAFRAPNTLVPNQLSATCSHMLADSQKLIGTMLSLRVHSPSIQDVLQHPVSRSAAAMCVLSDYGVVRPTLLPRAALVIAKLWARGPTFQLGAWHCSLAE